MSVFKFRLLIRAYNDMFGEHTAPHVPDAEWGAAEEDAYPKLDAHTRKLLMRGFADELGEYVIEHVSLTFMDRRTGEVPISFKVEFDAPAEVRPAPRVKTDPHLATDVTVRVTHADVEPPSGRKFMKELNHVLEESNQRGGGFQARGKCTLGPPRAAGRSGSMKRRRTCEDPWTFGYTMDAQGRGRVVPNSATVELRETVETIRRRRPGLGTKRQHTVRTPFFNNLPVFDGSMSAYLSAIPT
jgi:hypothetical protein